MQTNEGIPERRSSKKTTAECKMLINEMAFLIGEYSPKNPSTQEVTVSNIITILKNYLPEARMPSRCKYKIENIVLLIFIFILMGYRNCCDFEWICKWKAKELRALGLIDKKIPSHDCFLRVLKVTDAEGLCEAFKKMFELLLSLVDHQANGILAMDGQYCAGSDRKENTANPQRNVGSFTVYETGSKTIITSVAIDSKESEMDIARRVLASLNLKNTIICADALHCQTTTTSIVCERGGAYLFTLKDNQPDSYQEALKYGATKLVNFNKSSANFIQYDSKQCEKQIYLIPASKFTFDYKFAGLRYVVLYRKINKKTKEITDLWLITSEKRKYKIFEAVKMRWCLENEVHRDRDMLFDHDKQRYIDKNLANNMAIIQAFAAKFVLIAQKAIGAPSKRVTALVLKSDFIRVITETLKAEGKKTLFQKMFGYQK